MQGASCESCGCNRSMCMWVSILLFVGGLAHAVPSLYQWLSDLTGGFPVIQIVVGIVSVIVAIMMTASHRNSVK
jgi:hypothetical protein